MNSFQQGFQNQYTNQIQQQPFNQVQTTKYQPVGFVQSQYQGIPKQTNFGYQNQNTNPVLSHVGLTNQNQNQNYGISSTGQTFTRSSNPVISHAGLTAQQTGQSYGIQTQNAYQTANPVIAQTAHTGIGGMQNFATNAQYSSHASVAQPVISHVGYTAGQDFSRNQFSQQNAYGQAIGGNLAQASQAHAVTAFNPVYQATNATQQEGPVISKLGYTAGQQMQQVGQSNYGSFQRF